VLDSNDPNIPDSIRLAEKIFFEAMRDGYAKQGVKKQPIVGLPGSKSIPWERGMWKVIDTYFTASDSNKSSGFTLIVYNGSPIWVMHYGGIYPKEVMPFLKQCLKTAYDLEIFSGGRGRSLEQSPDFRYRNIVAKGSTFEVFAGDEHIYVMSDDRELAVGHHWYRGHSLI
jgi:hypothetical protein